MKIIKGNKIQDLTKEELISLVSTNDFKNIVIDLGCGDGRFIYKKALRDKNTLYIGVDPSEKQLEIYSKKANRKRLNNVLFILGSIEQLPSELKNIADKVFIILPWGSLLESIIKPNKDNIDNILSLLKEKGMKEDKKMEKEKKLEEKIEIIFGYAGELEQRETKRLDLPNLSEEYIKEEIIPMFKLEYKLKRLEKEDLRDIDTTWGKKLTFGRERPLFKLVLFK